MTERDKLEARNKELRELTADDIRVVLGGISTFDCEMVAAALNARITLAASQAMLPATAPASVLEERESAEADDPDREINEFCASLTDAEAVILDKYLQKVRAAAERRGREKESQWFCDVLGDLIRKDKWALQVVRMHNFVLTPPSAPPKAAGTAEGEGEEKR